MKIKMRSYIFLLVLLLFIPCSFAYANLPPITEVAPTLTLDVNETFPPSTSDGGASSGGGAFGGGNVTGTVEDALNNETKLPDNLQEELEQAQEKKDRAQEEKEARKNPDKEGSAAVTIESNILENSLLIPLLAIIVVIGIIISIIISGKKKKKTELPKKV